tara:strand:+ start:167 stop:1174 length:1008 start_codon:yes stop_codon:yes gene_type:complete
MRESNKIPNQMLEISKQKAYVMVPHKSTHYGKETDEADNLVWIYNSLTHQAQLMGKGGCGQPVKNYTDGKITYWPTRHCNDLTGYKDCKEYCLSKNYETGRGVGSYDGWCKNPMASHKCCECDIPKKSDLDDFTSNGVVQLCHYKDGVERYECREDCTKNLFQLYLDEGVPDKNPAEGPDGKEKKNFFTWNNGVEYVLKENANFDCGHTFMSVYRKMRGYNEEVDDDDVDDDDVDDDAQIELESQYKCMAKPVFETDEVIVGECGTLNHSENVCKNHNIQNHRTSSWRQCLEERGCDDDETLMSTSCLEECGAGTERRNVCRWMENDGENNYNEV